jgi:hypothetical protein
MSRGVFSHLILLCSAINFINTLKMKILLNRSILLAIFITGCTPKMTVSPMERYHLADVVMKADRDPLSQKMNDHAYFSREGSRGGRGIGGGGCGCN